VGLFFVFPLTVFCIHARIHYFQFPTGSTTLPVNVTIKQIRPHLRSAVCRCTQFATLSTTTLCDQSGVWWAAENELCRRTYL